jgi:hypothetical protein
LSTKLPKSFAIKPPLCWGQSAGGGRDGRFARFITEEPMIARLTKISLRLAPFALALLTLGAATPSRAADDCQADMPKLMQQRMSQIEKLNAIGKAGKGKIDPMAACPVAKALVASENQLLAYMTKNKDWCQIPDQYVAQLKEAQGRDQMFASKACEAAANFKKMQDQQRAAANGGMGPPRLPAGPL